ncbi:hypothetical protein [Dyadobacter luticola]|uniref:Uncharacterized protein n=1 Tax=Dyadobacter luticola TaxID=1979387 RepID=A0A5R9KW45_9BACT|nr:hypothetical protein [Dyadobacter luticola]TLV00502.1 hypothetical protein FEN17_13520 [Dyadobacter luticola]
MKTFNSIDEAFGWWLATIYPTLPAQAKKGRLTYAWRDFTHKRGISHARMKEILSEYGEFEIQTIIKYLPK